MLIIVLYAQGTRQKSYGPILNLPILTDTDSNRFLRILTLPIPIPIFIHKYHTDTDTDFLKNTDIPIPIPIIPIIGPSLTTRLCVLIATKDFVKHTLQRNTYRQNMEISHSNVVHVTKISNLLKQRHTMKKLYIQVL